MNDERTIEQLSRQALDIQDACNLTGVVHAMSRAASRLRTLYPNECTGFYNRHSVLVLFSDKIAHLTNASEEFPCAYRVCKALAQ